MENRLHVASYPFHVDSALTIQTIRVKARHQ